MSGQLSRREADGYKHGGRDVTTDTKRIDPKLFILFPCPTQSTRSYFSRCSTLASSHGLVQWQIAAPRTTVCTKVLHKMGWVNFSLHHRLFPAGKPFWKSGPVLTLCNLHDGATCRRLSEIKIHDPWKTSLLDWMFVNKAEKTATCVLREP